MALSVQQQIYELIKRSGNILIALKKDPGGDSIGSGLALTLVLEKLGKSCEIASVSVPEEKYSFLPKINKIKSGIDNLRDFIISIDTKENPIDEIRYETSPDKLDIYLSGKTRNLTKEKITMRPLNFRYDLVIVLDSPDLENLGSLYDKNPELFFNTPIVNIDHHPANEYFGKINLVDIVASSTAEILINFFYSVDKTLLNEKIATCLLAGIISDTNSFQGPSTTPATLICAANLIVQGADQSQIVYHLYKTRPISILKLLGRIMAGLKLEPELKFGWTIVDRKDFWKTKTGSQDLNYIIEELSRNSMDLSIILLLWEKDRSTNGKIYFSKKDTRLAELAESLKQNFKISAHHKEQNIIDFTCPRHNVFKTKKFISKKIKNAVANNV